MVEERALKSECLEPSAHLAGCVVLEISDTLRVLTLGRDGNERCQVGPKDPGRQKVSARAIAVSRVIGWAPRMLEPALFITLQVGFALPNRHPDVIHVRTCFRRTEMELQLMHQVDEIEILPGSFGTSRRLQVHRFGDPSAGPKVYVQASLHADETPAMLAAHHLLHRLAAADRAGEIIGQVVVVPFANPIGLSQRLLNVHLGRSDLGGGGNFNRNFPDIAPAVIERVKNSLGQDRRSNDKIIRSALREVAARAHGALGTRGAQDRVLRLATDADIVLDLHCHYEGITYLYCNGAGWPKAEDLRPLCKAAQR